MNIIEISSSITHIEDLPPIEFLNIVSTIEEYDITEKVDGAQLLFGVDENGFYTSRESKGGARVYEAAGYLGSFSNTYMRSAHLLLNIALPFLKEAGLRIGDQVEAEVLFGELPNVVPYSADKSHLIFLRTTAGNVSIDRLNERLADKSFAVGISRPVTPDGRSVLIVEDTDVWQFARVPQIAIDTKALKKILIPQVLSFVTYLNEDSGIKGVSNGFIESTPLNKCPKWCEASDWKIYKDLTKEKKESVRTVVKEHQMSIKTTLLNTIVRNRASAFGPLHEDGGWIEGVVLKHRATGETVKLVDKTVFGTIREFAWDVRNTLTEGAKSVDNASSFLGKLQVEMATALGHPLLGTIQAKSYLRKVGPTTEDRIAALAEGIDVSAVKDYWLNLLERKEADLCRILDKYEEDRFTKVLSISEDTPHRASIVSYGNPDIDRRTKETFASLFERISTYIAHTKEAVIAEDLLQILVGKQLGDLT